MVVLLATRPGMTRTLPGTLRALLASTRPMSALLAPVMTCAVIWVRAGLSLRCLAAGLAMFALTAFGFQINDVLDYRKDAAAQVQRPIATGLLSRRAAMLFALALLLIAFAVAAWVGAGWRVLAVTAAALILYTPCAHGVPLIKGLYVAALCIVPLYYGSVVSGAAYAWPPYALLAAFIVGREALMDANEVRGDRGAGQLTIAVLLGAGHARWIGVSLMAFSILCEFLSARGWVAKTSAVVALLLLGVVLVWPRLDEDRRIELSRIPMLAAALAVACG